MFERRLISIYGPVFVFSKSFVDKYDLESSIDDLFDEVRLANCAINWVTEPSNIEKAVELAVEVLTDAGFETELVELKDVDNFDETGTPACVLDNEKIYKVKISKDAIHKHLYSSYQALMRVLKKAVANYKFDDYVTGLSVLSVATGIETAVAESNDVLVFDYDKWTVSGLTDLLKDLYNSMADNDEEWYYLIGVYYYHI